MACCRHGHEPTTSNLLRRFYREHRPWQFTIRLRSESSHCSSEDDDAPSMVVELRMRFRLTFTVPSPEKGRSYLFEPASVPEGRWQLPIHGDPAQHFSSLDAALDSLAPLIAHLAPAGRLSLHLHEVVGRFAWAAVTSGRITGEQGPIRVLADAEFLHMLSSHQAVDDLVDGRPRDLARSMNLESSTLETCAVCLQEIRGGWLRTIRLPCSHRFHLNCISPWLQRSNSCPMCRGTVPLTEDDDRAIESGFVFPA